MRVKLLLRAAVGAVFVVVVTQACGDSAQQNAPRAAAGEGGGVAEAGSEQASGAQTQPDGGNATSQSGAAGATPSAAGASGEAAVGGAGACPEGPAGKAPSDYLAEFSSGTRLKARFYAAAGMPDAFAGFFDGELGVWCDFLLASDDKLRCLPRTTGTGLNAYSDSTCKQRAAVVSHACATGAGGYFREQLECLDKFAIHGAAPYAGVWYGGTPANCTENVTAA